MSKLTDLDLKRIRELIKEIHEIYVSDNPEAYIEILKDSVKELKDIVNK